MLIVVRFGYRQRRYFTINCLTASLADFIFLDCMAEMVKLCDLKEAQFQKEIVERTKKGPLIQKKIETLDSKIKAAAAVAFVRYPATTHRWQKGSPETSALKKGKGSLWLPRGRRACEAERRA